MRQQPQFTPEQEAEMKESREKSDRYLTRVGAEYKFDDSGKKFFDVPDEKIARISKEKDEEDFTQLMDKFGGPLRTSAEVARHADKLSFREEGLFVDMLGKAGETEVGVRDDFNVALEMFHKFSVPAQNKILSRLLETGNADLILGHVVSHNDFEKTDKDLMARLIEKSVEDAVQAGGTKLDTVKEVFVKASRYNTSNLYRFISHAKFWALKKILGISG